MGLESNLECQVCHTFWYGRVRPSEVLWKPFPKRGTASHATAVMIGHIGSYLLCTAGLSSLRPSEKGFCAVKPVQSKSIPESHLFSSWTLLVWCLDYFSWFAIFKFKTAFQFKSVNLWKSVRFQWEISIEIGFSRNFQGQNRAMAPSSGGRDGFRWFAWKPVEGTVVLSY